MCPISSKNKWPLIGTFSSLPTLLSPLSFLIYILSHISSIPLLSHLSSLPSPSLFYPLSPHFFFIPSFLSPVSTLLSGIPCLPSICLSMRRKYIKTGSATVGNRTEWRVNIGLNRDGGRAGEKVHKYT